MRITLLIVDFLALALLFAWARVEEIWRDGEKMTAFAILFAFILANLVYVLQTPADPNARASRFMRAFRKAWTDDQSTQS